MKAVPPVPTFSSVDAVVMPEFISPVIFPVTFPVRFPVTLPVTSPVTAPTKLVAVATPETLRSSNSVCPSMSTFPLTSNVVNVETPVEFTSPSILPVILPVTFPVIAPVTLPVTSPSQCSNKTRSSYNTSCFNITY